MLPAPTLFDDAAALGWDFSCPDWEDRLRDGRSLVPDLPLDQRLADQAVAAFNNLRLPDVPGKPLLADAGGEWFRDIVRAVFGSLDGAGVRHVPEVFAMVPKKNNKTTGGAGVALTALLLNKRPRAELMFIGPTQEVADIAFSQAAGMIEADESGWLAARYHIKEHQKAIVDRVNKATLKVKTFDPKVVTGSKAVFILIDELHECAKNRAAASILLQLRGGMVANPESCLVFITTQSDKPPVGAFKAELKYARGVRDGRILDQVGTLPILYEFPEKMQTDPEMPWRDPKLWHMVTPNLGLSIELETLVAGYHKAVELGEAELRRWASQHLNIQIGLALHDDRWRGADHWEAAGDPEIATLEDMLERCEVAVVGVDGGGLDDLLGLCVTGRERVTKRWLAWHKAFAQSSVREARKEITPQLDDFEESGDLVFCEIGTEDLQLVADICEQIADAGLLPEKNAIGLDPQSVAALIDELVARGIEPDQIIGVPQGYRLSNAIWGMERKLADGTYRHGDRELMAWSVGNASAEQRGNAVLITKQAAGKFKIDPLIAGFNAFSLMSLNPTAARVSYTARAPLVVV